jgi:hypothetical protein
VDPVVVVVVVVAVAAAAAVVDFGCSLNLNFLDLQVKKNGLDLDLLYDLFPFDVLLHLLN